MPRLFVAATRFPGETRAVLSDAAHSPLEIRLFRGTPETAEGAVWRGRVVGTMPGMRAVLVDVGGAMPGLLPLSDWPGDAADLDEGRAVLVMIEAPARMEKGPRLSGRVRLATPRLIFSPFRAGTSVSQRLAPADADRLRAWVAADAAAGEGWVARGAAAGFDAAALDRDRRRLRQRWGEIVAAMKAGGDPACLRAAPDPFAEWLAEMVGDLDTVSVSGGVIGLAARGVLVERVPLLIGLGDPFAEAGGEDALAAALSPVVALPGGGRISIEATRAFWAVDVDGGGVSAPDAARRVNDAAVDMLARQMRLRNLGGPLVMDAIAEGRRGPAPGQGKRLCDRLRRAAADDPRLEVAGASPLGHIEMVRARRGLSLYEAVNGDPLGGGDAATETEGLAALRDLVVAARTTVSGRPAGSHLPVSARVAGWLAGAGRSVVAEAESVLGARIAWRIAGGDA